jgi:beta-lactam-binding protein with PASTA domain
VPAAPKPGKGPPASLPTKGKNVAVPDLVGGTLAEAEIKLRTARLVMTAESTKGDRTAIEPDWEVCETVPAAGRRAPAGSPIAVIAAAPGDC